MKKTTLAALVIAVLGFVGLTVLKGLMPQLEKAQTLSTSDARSLKGEITIALDSWVGYFPLQSPVFKKLMRDEGYRLVIEDDKADYASRMSRLKEGSLDFAVATVDSYLVNGKTEGYPGTIVSVIDESKGGDAIVAWKDEAESIEALKNGSSGKRISFTPASPSEHLLNSLAIHFGIDSLLESGVRQESGGSEEAYEDLMNKRADVAVLWEPWVSEALKNKGIVKILGSEDTEKLIVDILLVNRGWARDNPQVAQLFVENFFKTQSYYAENREILEKDIRDLYKLDKNQVAAVLEGVQWISLAENGRWMGVNSQNLYSQEELVRAVDSAVYILEEAGNINGNPLPNGDPYTIMDSTFVETAFLKMGDQTQTSSGDSLSKAFSPLSDEQWNRMSVVGSLKIRPVTFQSGTSELDRGGEEQVMMIADTLAHYPNFRVVVKGHTGTRGDADANRSLSAERALAVKEYLVSAFSMSEHRIHTVGMGGDEPLKRKDGESSRSYNDRLKRVEVFLVSF